MSATAIFSVGAALFWAALALAVSAHVVRRVRGEADRLGLVQIPNERSAHKTPIPAGGGIGIAAGTLVAAVPIVLLGDGRLLALLLIATLLAVLGFLDDRRPLPALPRFVLQALAVGAILFVLFTALSARFPTLSGWVSFWLILLFCGVWWLNLFNFMDGIDGLAGQQAGAMLAGTALIGLVAAWPGVLIDPLFLLTLVALMAVVGFLVFNWPPASIMMGDAGALFLGGLLYAVGLAAVAKGWMSAPQALILAALFVTDATITILRRLTARENILGAHRSHAYQRLFRKAGGARPVTGWALAINLFVLLPLALTVGHDPVAGVVAMLLVYGTLAVAALLLGAGRPEDD